MSVIDERQCSLKYGGAPHPIAWIDGGYPHCTLETVEWEIEPSRGSPGSSFPSSRP